MNWDDAQFLADIRHAVRGSYYNSDCFVGIHSVKVKCEVNKFFSQSTLAIFSFQCTRHLGI